MPNSNEKYEVYKNKLQEIADIKFAAAVLQWDQETYLPRKGNEIRGRQISTLSEVAHKEFTTDNMGNLLNELLSFSSLNDNQRRNVELSKEDFEKNKKLPSHFVRKMSDAVNKSFHSWIHARKENDFSYFQDPLQTIIELKRQEADLIGYQDHPYSALMNEYDKGLNVQFADNLFSTLIPALSLTLGKIKNKPEIPNDFLHKNYDKNVQWKFGIDLLKFMHFDFEAGRQDISEHPFTTNFNSKDVRVTTRIDENDLANMTWSCIHEGGHALYEQGLPLEQYGLPLGEYCSLSIHESQSRLWENCIGRSLPFWEFQYPLLQKIFPTQLNDISVDLFYRGINKVIPSLIRTEADELTYHFHVMIRYEIEKKLIEGSIQAKDIPAIWNEYYEKNLGLTVPDDRKGCLQDVHWSHGSFGYFATYSIGSLYSAQIWNSIKTENTQVEKQLREGNSYPVFEWLTKNIFPYGRYYNSSELCKQATGEILNTEYFIKYIIDKYNSLYKI